MSPDSSDLPDQGTERRPRLSPCKHLSRACWMRSSVHVVAAGCILSHCLHGGCIDTGQLVGLPSWRTLGWGSPQPSSTAVKLADTHSPLGCCGHGTKRLPAVYREGTASGRFICVAREGIHGAEKHEGGEKESSRMGYGTCLLTQQ